MLQNQKQTISFFGTVAAAANVTLVSQRITAAFRTKIIRASFAPGVQRLMRLFFSISRDPSAPTTKFPEGTNILASTGQVTFITGDDEFKTFPHEVETQEAGAFVKVFAENTDAAEHTIDTQVTIEFIDESDDKKD